MEENSKKNIVNQFEAGSNCQVFNGNITGCVFAMPGSAVTQQGAMQPAATPAGSPAGVAPQPSVSLVGSPAGIAPQPSASLVGSPAGVAPPSLPRDAQPSALPAPSDEGYSRSEPLFRFIHPSADSRQEWLIHDEVKHLVTRQGIQEICQYLKQLADDRKILLPQSPLAAYSELVRMGMPSSEGFNEKTFQKYYRRG